MVLQETNLLEAEQYGGKDELALQPVTNSVKEVIEGGEAIRMNSVMVAGGASNDAHFISNGIQ